MVTQKTLLQDYYHHEELEYELKNDDGMIEPIIRPTFLCHGVPELVNHVAGERGINPNDCLLKFSIDKGHDKIKAGLNIIEKDALDNEGPKAKRARYCDGIAPSLHQSTSANRMQILAMVPSIQESYVNLKSILDNLPGM